MVAKFVTISGESVALVLARPNRATHPTAALSFPTEITADPNSKRESRRTFARNARYEIQYRVRLTSADEATEFRIWLAQQKDQTIAIPLWVDACRLTSAAAIGATTLFLDQHPVRSGSTWIVMNADASAYEIITIGVVGPASVTVPGGIANNWPKGTAIYPLIFGRLNERPELDARTPSKAECDLQFKEASVFARRINQYPATIPTVGAQVPNLAAYPLWPVMPTSSRVLDRTEAQIVFDQVGFGRTESKLLYNQPNARILELEFVCRSRDQIAQVEYFFAAMKGDVTPFCIVPPRNDLELAADITPTTSTFTIKTGEYSNAGRTPHQGDPYIGFCETTGFGIQSIDPHKILTVAGATLTTVQPITVAHLKARTRIGFLHLVRVIEPKLAWDYSRDDRATCRLKFLELPNEYTAPSPVLKESFFGYLFVEASKYPRKWLFTSYEDQIVLGGDQGFFAGTYTPALIGHKTLRRTLDLPAQKLTIESGSFPGNPLSLFFPFQLEGKLLLYLIEGSVVDLLEPVKVRFFGEVTAPHPTLKEGQVQLLGRDLDQSVPQHMFSTVDNFDVLSGPLSQDPEDWKITGTLASIASTTIDVASAPAHTLVVADPTYFNHGEIELGNTGATYETRVILDSVAITGGVRLTLNRPLIKTVATGGAIDLYPGYDFTIDQRTTRFLDPENHGGMPYAPDTSPNIKAVGTANASSGKK